MTSIYNAYKLLTSLHKTRSTGHILFLVLIFMYCISSFQNKQMDTILVVFDFLSKMVFLFSPIVSICSANHDIHNSQDFYWSQNSTCLLSITTKIRSVHQSYKGFRKTYNRDAYYVCHICPINTVHAINCT